VQRELREISGTSILIYDQTCATEKRRRRKRGTYPDPARRVVINEAVCEGCGDCSVKSNCLSVEPLDTEYGTQAPDQPVDLQQGLLVRERLLPELRLG
jgi:indolepyruvate ferredoxin oxidoreductase